MNEEKTNPNLNYTPKIIVPYTDIELQIMATQDGDDNTFKWEKTVNRVREEAYKQGAEAMSNDITKQLLADSKGQYQTWDFVAAFLSIIENSKKKFL